MSWTRRLAALLTILATVLSLGAIPALAGGRDQAPGQGKRGQHAVSTETQSEQPCSAGETGDATGDASGSEDCPDAGDDPGAGADTGESGKRDADAHGPRVNLTGRGRAAEFNPNVDEDGNLIPGLAAEKSGGKDAEDGETGDADAGDEDTEDEDAGDATRAERLARMKAAARAKARAERQKGEQGAYLIYVNGERINLTPVVRGGRTLVPFRRLAEALGALVSWEPATRTVTVVKGDVTVVLRIGATTALVNGEEVPLDVPPELADNQTVVPLRFLATALGAVVEYDPETGAIIIVAPPESGDGSTDDGSTDNGTAVDGSTDDGTSDDGATDDGSTGDGSTGDGTTSGQ